MCGKDMLSSRHDAEKINSAGARTRGDPWFAWLRTISQLIVVIDESLDEKEALTNAGVDAVMSQAVFLLIPAESGGEFGEHYVAHYSATRVSCSRMPKWLGESVQGSVPRKNRLAQFGAASRQ
jgi:hypothetical protein